MQLLTVGFTKKNAETFFTLLAQHQVTCLVDIRLHPNGQLSGFARGEDLAYFCPRLAGCAYQRMEVLAPSETIFSAYRKDHDWEIYARRYADLMRERAIPASLDRAWFAAQRCCLLCSEATPEQCHRRILAELIADAWGDVEITHIV
jgi:uncharacterized protein (DUF488 family)